MPCVINCRVYLKSQSPKVSCLGMRTERTAQQCHFLWVEVWKTGSLFANSFCIRSDTSGLCYWVKWGKTRYLTCVEADVTVNPAGYFRVRNVRIHSLSIRYRMVCGPAIRLQGRIQNRAKMMTEIIAALIAPHRAFSANAGTFRHWCWKDITTGYSRSLSMLLLYFSGRIILAGHCHTAWAHYERHSSDWQERSSQPLRHQLCIAQ